ncbi:hypothetical protein Tco_1183410 [Tanacetum coccineum]
MTTLAENIIVAGAENRPPILENSILYNLFDKFASVQDETLFNTKFLNALPLEWSKFVTDVKLAKNLYTTNYDQLYAYLRIATTSRGNFTAGQARVMKCYNYLREGHMVKQCTQPKRPRNSAWFKEKLMLAEAQEAAFQTEDLDAYDSNCDDISSAKVVLMENLSSCDSDVLFEVPYFDTYPDDMINQDVQDMPYSEQTHIVDFLDNEITSDSNIIPYSQYLQESQDAGIQDTNSSTPNDLLILSLVEQMTDQDNSGKNHNAPTFNQLFEINELKPQSQEKDTVIRKLKDMVKSMSGKESVEKVKDIDEIETINIEQEHNTDIKEMDKNQSKNGQSQTREGKSAQEPGIIKLWSTKVNPGQPLSQTHK